MADARRTTQAGSPLCNEEHLGGGMTALDMHTHAQDIEQLLAAHGLHSTGPNQVLQNLYKLLAAAASAGPFNSSGCAQSM